MHDEKKPKVTLLQKTGLVLLSTVITIGLVALVGSYIRIEGDSLNKKIILKAWYLKNHLFGPQEIAIYRPDSVLGWSNKPLSSGSQFEPYGFYVDYTIDEAGNRVTTGSYDLPKILFLGCSFTFGHGVENDEAYPTLLSRYFPDYKVVNGATNGWGTVQVWLKLRQELRESEDIRLVVYGFIGHHQHRNYLRKSWLELLSRYGRQNAYVEVDSGRIVRNGLADVERHGIANESLLIYREKKITLHLVRDMKQLCEDREIPFLIVYLPDDKENDLASEMREAVGESCFVDLRGLIDYHAIHNGVDGHPNPEGHHLIATELEPILERLMQREADYTEDTSPASNPQ